MRLKRHLPICLYLAVELCLAGAAGPAVAAKSGTGPVTIFGTMDQHAISPLVAAFTRAHPGVDIDYHDMLSGDIQDAVVHGNDSEGPSPDLLLSSAMDMQMKLANDGYASSYHSPRVNRLPDWAVWRNEAFAFSFEPIVIIYNKRQWGDGPPPSSRFALMRMLRDDPERFRGRIGVYNPETSGTGYLLLASDAQQSEIFWEMAGGFGALGARLFDHNAQIIERVVNGDLLLGYDVAGSYAQAWAAAYPDLGIVYPNDYTLVLSRIAIIPRTAINLDGARQFLDFLVSLKGQKLLAGTSHLHALHPEVDAALSMVELRRDFSGRLRRIPVGPELLVYLDPLNRQRFLEHWNSAMTPVSY